MGYKATNNAYALLASAISASATTLTVQSGYGNKFPQITAPDFTYLTLENASGVREIVKVTSRALGQDVMTIERAQEGFTAVAWSAGDVVECRPTAKIIQTILSHIDATASAHNASAIAVTPTGSISATDVQAALAELDAEKVSAGDGNANINAIGIFNAAGWSVTPSGTTLLFSFNGVNVAKLDSSGNLTAKGTSEGGGTV